MPSGETVPEEQIKPWFAKQADKPHYKPAVISIKISNIRKLRASVAITEIGSKLQALGDDMAKDEITKMFEADGLW